MIGFSDLSWIFKLFCLVVFFLSVNRHTAASFFPIDTKWAIHGTYYVMSHDTKECPR